MKPSAPMREVIREVFICSRRYSRNNFAFSFNRFGVFIYVRVWDERKWPLLKIYLR